MLLCVCHYQLMRSHFPPGQAYLSPYALSELWNEELVKSKTLEEKLIAILAESDVSNHNALILHLSNFWSFFRRLFLNIR